MVDRRTELESPRTVPHLWSALWDDEAWPFLTPAIEAVEVLDAGDRHGNGRLRRVHQRRRWWDPTIMLERTQDVAHHRSVTTGVHHHRADVRHEWTLRLVPGPDGGSRLTLDETVEVAEPRYPGEARLLTGRLLGLRPELLGAITDEH